MNTIIQNYADWALNNNVVSDPLFLEIAEPLTKLIKKYKFKNILVELDN
jgi:hypothetical protein